MSDKIYFKQRISTKKLAWNRLGPENEATEVFERKDKLARIYCIDSQYTVVVPMIGEKGEFSYRHLGPFIKLKKAKQAGEEHLHDTGFIVYREDLKNASIRPPKI